MVVKREYVRKNMRREAVMMQRLSHPNVVQLIEVMETENSFYMTIEYAEGGDFMKYLTDRNNLSESETRKFMRQIVSAVDHMHRSGVVHRDLKIENLLLDADCNMKIIDFGLSNHWDGESLLATQCGSPAYAAPEIFSKQHYGPEVDVWSIGINMFAMLTGRLPFLVDPPNNLQKLHTLILRGARVPEYLSPDCQNLLSRLLEPHESRRISLEEVLAHPWLNEGCMPMDQWGLKVKPTAEEINLEAIWYMVEHLNSSEESIRDSVTNFRPNATTGNYFIICQRLRNGNGLPNGARYPHTHKLASHSHARKSLRNSKLSLAKAGSSTTIQSEIEPKRNGHRTQMFAREQTNSTQHQHPEPDLHVYFHAPAQNGYTNGYASEPNNHLSQAETAGDNGPQPEAVMNHAQINGYQTDEQTTYASSLHHQQVMNNMVQNQQQPPHYQYSSNPNVSALHNGIQREKATPIITSGRATPVNQQVYDIRDITNGDLTKRTSLPDIPYEVSITPRTTYRDTLKLNSKRRKPKRDKNIQRTDKSSSVPDHLNVLGAGYGNNKHRPSQLADSIALRNTRNKLRYNSKPEDLNHIAKYSSKPESLNYTSSNQMYYPQQPAHCTIDPGTVLHGTHQITPSEQAHMDAMKAKELLKKQVIAGYDYPGAPPSTTQTPRRFGYVTSNGGGSKMASRENVSSGMDERSKTMPDFDARNGNNARSNGAHSKENHISNVGYYTIPDNRASVKSKVSQNGPHRDTDATKYQSPFVKKDVKRVSGRSTELYKDFATPRGRNHTVLAQAIGTPR